MLYGTNDQVFENASQAILGQSASSPSDAEGPIIKKDPGKQVVMNWNDFRRSSNVEDRRGEVIVFDEEWGQHMKDQITGTAPRSPLPPLNLDIGTDVLFPIRNKEQLKRIQQLISSGNEDKSLLSPVREEERTDRLVEPSATIFGGTEFEHFSNLDQKIAEEVNKRGGDNFVRKLLGMVIGEERSKALNQSASDLFDALEGKKAVTTEELIPLAAETILYGLGIKMRAEGTRIPDNLDDMLKERAKKKELKKVIENLDKYLKDITDGLKKKP